MIELCEINKDILDNWKPQNEQEQELKEFVELYAKTSKLGRKLGLVVAVF